MRLLIYALGGGFGDLNSALALGRADERRGHEVRIMSNAPREMSALTDEHCRIERIDAYQLKIDKEAAEAEQKAAE